MKIKYFSFTLLLLFGSLIGCSSSDDNPVAENPPVNGTPPVDGTPPIDNVPTGNVDLWGVVDISHFVTDNEVDLGAFFAQFSNGVSVDLLQENFVPQLDTCEFSVSEAFNPDEFMLPDLDNITANITMVSAGDAITFGSTAGSFAELTRTTEFGFTFYESPNDVIGPIPAGLTIDIPGDVFPAFANVTIPAVAPFQLTSPTGVQPVTASTAFTWVAGSNPNAYIEIDALSFDIATSTSSSVSCTVTDDGSFSFPASTQAEMGAGFSTFAGVDAARVAISFVQQSGAILVIANSSAI